MGRRRCLLSARSSTAFARSRNPQREQRPAFSYTTRLLS
jgi:hypothetical protein